MPGGITFNRDGKLFVVATLVVWVAKPMNKSRKRCVLNRRKPVWSLFLRLLSCILLASLAVSAKSRLTVGAERELPRDAENGYLPAAGDKSTTASAYGLEPGMHLLLLGYYPVRELVDWSDPPMDANSDWTAVEGVQFGGGAGQIDLEDVFQSVRMPSRFEGKYWYSAFRADGWLWIERDGEYAFRIAKADDAGRLAIAGKEVIGRSREHPSKQVTVQLQKGLHRLRLDGFNREWGLSLVTEWQPPGDDGFSELPASLVFRGHALREGPRVFQTAVAGLAYDYPLSVKGGKSPYRFRVVRGALPKGIALSATGRLHGRAAEPGFFCFTVAVTDGCEVSVEEALGLRVLPEPTRRDRNDGQVFQLAFDDTDPKTLRGGLISGRGMYEGLQTVGEFALYPFHAAAPGQSRSIAVEEGRGAFGSTRYARIQGAKEYGFFFSGRQDQLMSDSMPALRKANRVAIAFRFPQTATVQTSAGPVRYDWRADPRAFYAAVLGGVHLAGHNVTRYVGHQKEQWNWHFYHPASRYWGDHWQTSKVYYLGEGWWCYETSNQSTSQRSGTVDLAGWYEPQQDTDATYFDSLSRFYHVVDLGWGKTNNTYASHAFDVDQIRIYREEPGVEIRYGKADKVARIVIPTAQASLNVPFQITHTHERPARYWVSKYGGKIPIWNGESIFVDQNGNGSADPEDQELDTETPLFQPGETRHFVYRVATERLPVGQTMIAGVNLRVHDREDPLSLRGDSMMILIHKASDPNQVHLPSLTTLSKDRVLENRPPIARIDGPAVRPARAGEPVQLTGSVSDPDGPQQPLPVWDFGDASPLQYGKSASHAYARPGTYTVRLRATDGAVERTATVTIRVVDPAGTSHRAHSPKRN